MSDLESGFDVEAARRVDQLCDEFERACQRKGVDDLGAWLARAGELASRALPELACIDLEYRLQAGEAVRVEEYLARFPVLRTDRAALLGLIEAEFRHRRRREPELTADTFRARFPELAAHPLWERIRCLEDEGSPSAAPAESTAAELSPPATQFPNPGDAAIPRGPDPANQSPEPGSAPGVEPQPVRVVGPGYRFNDRYVVERELGQGGMGKVYLARDDQLGRHVAVKVIRPQDPRLLELTVHRQEYARAFLEEAKVGAELDHPNIAKVFDFGIDHGEPFTVFEFVEGETLKEMLARRGRLPLEEAQDIIAALAQGLSYAHAHHIVHRDLKPANIRITPQGDVKILDLGLAARFREQADWHYCGTPTHVAPEQVASQPCDGRTDQYALAVIAYELVTGQLPFTSPNVGVLLEQHLREYPPSPQRLVSDLPIPVSPAILRGLAKKPHERFATCDEFAAAMGCQVVRRGAEAPRFVRLASLTATSGPRLSVKSARSYFGPRHFQSVYLALASDGLYAWHCEEVTRWALTELGEVKRKGATLTVLARDGMQLQTFTFAKKASCEALEKDLQQLLANRPAAPVSEESGPHVRRSVFLLAKRVLFTHQTLGSVAHQAKTKESARIGMQIQAHLLGAHAVAEVLVERLPTFFSGYRCSGVAIRAVHEDGRLEMGAHWLEQRAAALGGWMLASIGLLYSLILLGMSKNWKHNMAQDLQGMGYFLAGGLVPLLSGFLFRSLRWPQLVKPTAVIVLTLLLGMPIAVILGSAIVLAEMNRWLLSLFPLAFLDPLPWACLGATMFLLARTRQFSEEYRRLLAAYKPAVSPARRFGQGISWTVTVAFALVVVGVDGLIGLETVSMLNGPSQEEMDKAKQANDLFQTGFSFLHTQPETAEPKFRQALSLYEELRRGQPTNAAWSHQVARTHFNLASIALTLQRTNEAERHLREALTLMEGLVRDQPNDPDSQPYHKMMADIRTQLNVLQQAPAVGKPVQPPDADFQAKLAEVDRLVADIHAKVTNNPMSFPDAEPHCKKALELLEPLAERQPKNRKVRVGLFLACYSLGCIRFIQDKPAEAEQFLARAQLFAEQPRQSEDDNPELPFMLANLQAVRGRVWLDLNKAAEAETALQEAVASLRKLLAGPPPLKAHWRSSLPFWLQWQAHVHHRRSRWVEATACLQEASAALEKALAEQPDLMLPTLAHQCRQELRQDLIAVRSDYAAAELNKAADLKDKGQHEKARAPLEQARDLYAQVVEENPKDPAYRQSLGQCHYRLGKTHESLKHLDEAEAAYRFAVEVRAKLVAEAPDNREYRQELAQSHWAQAELSRAREHWTLAAQSYRSALEHYAGLAREQPKDADVRWYEAACHNDLAWSLENKKNLAEASSEFRQAAGFWEKLANDFPKRIDYRQEQARSQNSLVRVLRSSTRWADAEAAQRRLAVVRRKVVEAAPGNPSYRKDLAETYWDLAELLEKLGRWEDAAKEYRLTIALREQLVRETPKDTGRQWALAASRNRLGLALRKMNQEWQAEWAFQGAVWVWARLADDYPDRPVYKYEQARTLNNLVLVFRQAKRLPEEAQTLRKIEALGRQAAEQAPRAIEYAIALGEAQAALGYFELDRENSAAKALKWFDQAVQTLKPHLKDQEFGTWARRAAVDAYRGQANALADEDRFADAITAYDRILELCPPSEQPWYRGWRARYRFLAGDLAKAVEEAGAAADHREADAEDLFLAAQVLALAAGKEANADRAKEYADRALTRLRQAVAKGFKRVAELKQSDDLKALRSRKEFQTLVEELESPRKK